jgi:deazaflavin-dependent oxidoreductase (nitroreductase family)
VIPAELAATEELELITTGRRSGLPRSVRLWFAVEDDTLWLRTDVETPDWLLNLRRYPDCVVHIAGHRMNATNERIADKDEALRHLVALWRAKYGPEWVQDWYVEHGREPVRLRMQPST